MLPLAALLAAAAAIVAVLAACAMAASTIGEMRRELDEIKARPWPAPPQEPSSRHTPARMMKAIYPEPEGGLGALTDLPGGPALAVAGVLALASAGLGLLGSSAASRDAAGHVAEVATLRGALDSTRARVQILSDSLHQTLAAASPAATAAPKVAASPKSNAASRPAPARTAPPQARAARSAPGRSAP